VVALLLHTEEALAAVGATTERRHGEPCRRSTALA